MCLALGGLYRLQGRRNNPRVPSSDLFDKIRIERPGVTDGCPFPGFSFPKLVASDSVEPQHWAEGWVTGPVAPDWQVE